MSDNVKPEAVPEPEQEIPRATAVRVYEHADGQTEFPVLKAFQEYLEAEQAKAHKRMLSLSIFFIVLLVIVVLTFTIITASMNNRNQALSDRLMDIALRERTGSVPQPAAPIVNVQQPAVPQVDQDKSVKPILEKLEQLQAELARVRAEADAQKKAAAEAQSKVPSQSVIDANKKAAAATNEKALRQLEEIRQQQAAIKAAREQLKAEQEALHKEKVEQQRRRLYPEYYARLDARRAAEEAAKNPPAAPSKEQGQQTSAPSQVIVKLSDDKQPAQEQIEQKETRAPTPPSPSPSPSTVQPKPTQKKPVQPVTPPAVQPVKVDPIEAILEDEDLAKPVRAPLPSAASSKPAPKSALQAILDEDDAPKATASKPKSDLQRILDVDDAPTSLPNARPMTEEEAKKVEAELKNLMEEANRLEAEAAARVKERNEKKTAAPLSGKAVTNNTVQSSAKVDEKAQVDQLLPATLLDTKQQPQNNKPAAPQAEQKPVNLPVAAKDQKPNSPTVSPAAAKPQSKPVMENGTESLEIGGKDGKSIPWLVALPEALLVPMKDNKDEKKPDPLQPTK